jgi:uncharacterized protein (TIGR02246 family)
LKYGFFQRFVLAWGSADAGHGGSEDDPHGLAPKEHPMSSAADEKDAIRELMARYAQNLDAGRFAEVAGLFTGDAVWTTSFGTTQRRAEIEAMFERNVPKKGEGPQRKHYITNIIIKLHGNTASAVSDYLVVRESETGLMPVMGGTYRDTFVKSAGVWQFARKELQHDIAGDMALKNGP